MYYRPQPPRAATHFCLCLSSYGYNTKEAAKMTALWSSANGYLYYQTLEYITKFFYCL